MKLPHRLMTVAAGSCIALFIFSELVLGSHSWISLLPGLLMITVLPGWLVLKNLGITRLGAAETALYAVGLSLLVAMLTGLGLSVGFEALGWAKPLATPVLASTLALITAGLLLRALATRQSLAIDLSWPYFTLARLLAFLAPPLFTALSVMGAISLNNLGTNVLACLALAVVGIFIVAVIWSGQRVPAPLYPYAIFWIGLALLLSVSLRSWNISGHDILTEFYTYRQTIAHLGWSMHYYQDAYNACLSISILPAVFTQLIPVAADLVFRLILQINFALAPVALYFIVRRFFKPNVAFLAATLFLAQPPLMQDMPFLTRQETALGYFVLSISALSLHRLTRAQRNWLFGLLSLGMVLSHYSTTYMALGFYTFAVIFDQLPWRHLPWRRMRRQGRWQFWWSRLMPSARRLDISNRYWSSRHTLAPNWLMLIGVFAAAITWNSLLTHSSNNLGHFTDSTVKNLTTAVHSLAQDRTPAQVLASLRQLSASPTNDQLLATYAAVTTGTASGSSDEFSPVYPKSAYAGYTLIKHVNADLKATVNAGVVSVVTLARNLGRKLILLFILSGWGWVMWRTNRYRDINPHIAVVITAALALLATAMLVPQLSVDYDIMRTYQQLLVILCVPAAIGSIALLSWLRLEWRVKIMSIIIGGYFLLTSAYIPQIVGSGEALMQLNNNGVYYDLYYSHQTEQAAADWISHHLTPATPLYADWFAKNKLNALSPTKLWVISNVLPQNITTDGYVFMDYTNTTSNTAYAFYDGHILSYWYPTTFLDDQKDTLYSNGTTSIRR